MRRRLTLAAISSCISAGNPRLISTGGTAVNDQYVWLPFLPYEDKGKNEELDNFLRYDTKPDSFGTQACVDPVAPGTFDCTGSVVSLTLDPVAAFKG